MSGTSSCSVGRITRAERLVEHYSRVPNWDGEHDWMADVIDVLTDLRHFCRA